MRRMLLLIFAAISTTAASAATVIIDRDLGFDATDSTVALQRALSGDATTVVIRAMPNPWITGKLVLARSGVTVLLEPGAVLQAKAGAFPGSGDCLIHVQDCNDVALVGYGATLRMLNCDDPAYAQGEWRHCLALRGVEGALIRGLTCTRAGGDGILVARGYRS